MNANPSDAIARLLALGGELTPAAPGMQRRKYDLAHMRSLLQALGDPQSRFSAVLIAGTNGKGSTAATLASILKAAGHRTGLYTSPHLETPNERVQIDGQVISDEALASCFLRVESAAQYLIESRRLPYTPSFFETMTAIAFLQFAGTAKNSQASSAIDSQFPDGAGTGAPAVEIAILEVGLGGRLDSTNVVDPLLSVIADISLDHMQWLGSTISEITREKAGILRSGGILITLPQHPEANRVIGEIAVPLQVTAVNAADYLPAPTRNVASDKPLFTALRNRYDLSIPALPKSAGRDSALVSRIAVDSPLSGSHQQRNIALAIAAAISLHQQFGFSLTAEALEKGISATDWPGRLQLKSPPSSSPGSAPILLDAAHNPAGAWSLRAALSALPVEGPRKLIFTCMADKEVKEIGQILFPVFDEVLLTRVRSPRAATDLQLVEAAQPTGVPFTFIEQPLQALKAAQLCTPATGIIVIAGSLSLLGELMVELRDWPRHEQLFHVEQSDR